MSGMSCTAVDLSSALSELAGELEAAIPAAVERGVETMRREAPAFFVRDDDPDFVALYRDSYAEQLRSLYAGLARCPQLDGRELPPLAAEEARQAAALGIPLSAFLHVCRIGQRLVFEEALTAADALIDDRELLSAVLRSASTWLFEWFDWLTVRETEAYEQERDLLVRDRERRRQRLVRELLDGDTADGDQLGYALERDHLAVVAWGQNAERGVRELARRTGLELLAVPGSGATTWGWLGGADIGTAELRAVRAFAPLEGVQLAVGERGNGAEGFRVSHREAVATHRLARAGQQPLTLHADVALLTLTLQDPRAARAFVQRELGPLAAGDERAAVLRETLAAYFAAGQNAASAAAALGVHNRTVLYRVRSIEERLGHPIAARREELAVALRLAGVALREEDSGE